MRKGQLVTLNFEDHIEIAKVIELDRKEIAVEAPSGRYRIPVWAVKVSLNDQNQYHYEVTF